MNEETIDQASNELHKAVAEVVKLVGRDVARSLLIHYLHLVDTGELDPEASEPAA